MFIIDTIARPVMRVYNRRDESSNNAQIERVANIQLLRFFTSPNMILHSIEATR